MTSTERIYFRTSKRDKLKLQFISKKERRSMSNMVLNLIDKYISENHLGKEVEDYINRYIESDDIED